MRRGREAGHVGADLGQDHLRGDRPDPRDGVQTGHRGRELADLVRALPLKIFKEPEQRLKMVDAVQEALDKAIEQEEAELAAGAE